MLSARLKINNRMKINVLLPAMMTALIAIPAMATDQYNDRGRVLSVTQQTERVNVPRQECRTEYQQQSYQEQQYRDGNGSMTGPILGGIAGGLLGSTIGRGNGRVAAAAVGAGIGAIAGDRIGNRQSSTVMTSRSVPVQSCYQVDNWQTVNAGYLVTYEYNGRTYNTVTNQHPGRYVDVNVAVTPSNQGANYVENIQYNRADWDAPRNGVRRGEDHRRGHHDRDYY